MKHLLITISVCLFVFVGNVKAQEGDDDLGKLKAYYLVLLKTGPNRNQDSATAAQIQKDHLQHINEMAAAGQLNIAGPFLDEGDMRGIFVFDMNSEEDVRKLVDEDPAVKSGRLIYEIHPWMTQKGTCFK